MQAKAIVGGKLVSFRLSPELARAHRANVGKSMTDAEAVAFVGKKRRTLALRHAKARAETLRHGVILFPQLKPK